VIASYLVGVALAVVFDGTVMRKRSGIVVPLGRWLDRMSQVRTQRIMERAERRAVWADVEAYEGPCRCRDGCTPNRDRCYVRGIDNNSGLLLSRHCCAGCGMNLGTHPNGMPCDVCYSQDVRETREVEGVIVETLHTQPVLDARPMPMPVPRPPAGVRC
jgi:hypothetical protein